MSSNLAPGRRGYNASGFGTSESGAALATVVTLIVASTKLSDTIDRIQPPSRCVCTTGTARDALHVGRANHVAGRARRGMLRMTQGAAVRSNYTDPGG